MTARSPCLLACLLAGLLAEPPLSSLHSWAGQSRGCLGLDASVQLRRLVLQGAFGTVYLGELAYTGQFVAVKVLAGDVQLQDTLELQANLGLMGPGRDHPNLVRCLGCLVDPVHNRPGLVLELAPFGNLRSVVE